jgi:hypothetical protein
LPYTAWTRADASGAFELRLCVPTGHRAGGLTTDSRYAIGTASDSTPPKAIEVPEHAVRSGAMIDLEAAP